MYFLCDSTIKSVSCNFSAHLIFDFLNLTQIQLFFEMVLLNIFCLLLNHVEFGLDVL